MLSGANRVLIIEDERDLAVLMQSVLEDEGYQVLVHSTGDCADVACAFQPDVVITDYMLPVYDGRTVIECLHRDISADLPCILITAMPQAARYWREWGATDYLPKPFELDALVLSVERAAGEAAGNYADMYVEYQDRA